MCVKKDKKVAALILAAGEGSRMMCKVTKQRLSVLGKNILSRSVEAHEAATLIDSITVVCREDEVDFVRSQLSGINKKPVSVTVGGATRSESARLGFESLSEDFDYVSIHDAARCLITPENIDKVVSVALECGAATAATPMTDTVKLVGADGKIKNTVPRESLWAAATPQVFERELYSRALMEHAKSGIPVTDDNMLLENIGVYPTCVDTGRGNIKITTPEDLALAEVLIKRNIGDT